MSAIIQVTIISGVITLIITHTPSNSVLRQFYYQRIQIFANFLCLNCATTFLWTFWRWKKYNSTQPNNVEGANIDFESVITSSVFMTWFFLLTFLKWVYGGDWGVSETGCLTTVVYNSCLRGIGHFLLNQAYQTSQCLNFAAESVSVILLSSFILPRKRMSSLLTSQLTTS